MGRVDPVKVQAMVEASKVGEPAPAATPAPAASSAPAEDLAATIAFEDFAKVDLRVAQVLAAEEVPKAKKIVKLRVSLGSLGERTIFAGIKAAFPDVAVLVGRKIVVVANLAPRQMSFGLSEGMVIAAGDAPNAYLLSPDNGAEPGQRLH
jgi:methionyl-tRNA synthetase